MVLVNGYWRKCFKWSSLAACSFFCLYTTSSSVSVEWNSSRYPGDRLGLWALFYHEVFPAFDVFTSPTWTLFPWLKPERDMLPPPPALKSCVCWLRFHLSDSVFLLIQFRLRHFFLNTVATFLLLNSWISHLTVYSWESRFVAVLFADISSRFYLLLVIAVMISYRFHLLIISYHLLLLLLSYRGHDTAVMIWLWLFHWNTTFGFSNRNLKLNLFV